LKASKKWQEQLDQLRALDHAAKKLRHALGVSRPGEVIWRTTAGAREFLAVADGYGGGTALEVEGNYPIKFLAILEQVCPTEAEASRVAEGWFSKTKEPRP
jgi:hypothetical protein